jgi:hypothetical protein
MQSQIMAMLALLLLAAGIVATDVAVGSVAGPPGVVLATAVALITIAVYTFGGSQLTNYANEFNDPTLRDNMVQAMYAATDAHEGYLAFKSTLLAGMSTIPAEIIYTLWWSAWSNDIYSGTPEVDDSAFDGSICAPETDPCVDIDSVLTLAYDAAFPELVNRQCIYFPDIETRNSGFASTEFDPAIVVPGDYIGWSFELISGTSARLVMDSGGVVAIQLAPDTPYTITIHTSAFFVDDVTPALGLAGAYTIRWCAPV